MTDNVNYQTEILNLGIIAGALATRFHPAPMQRVQRKLSSHNFKFIRGLNSFLNTDF